MFVCVLNYDLLSLLVIYWCMLCAYKYRYFSYFFSFVHFDILCCLQNTFLCFYLLNFSYSIWNWYGVRHHLFMLYAYLLFLILFSLYFYLCGYHFIHECLSPYYYIHFDIFVVYTTHYLCFYLCNFKFLWCASPFVYALCFIHICCFLFCFLCIFDYQFIYVYFS